MEVLNQESQTLRAPKLWEKGGINPELELDFQQTREPEETDLPQDNVLLSPFVL